MRRCGTAAIGNSRTTSITQLFKSVALRVFTIFVLTLLLFCLTTVTRVEAHRLPSLLAALRQIDDDDCVNGGGGQRCANSMRAQRRRLLAAALGNVTGSTAVVDDDHAFVKKEVGALIAATIEHSVPTAIACNKYY